MATASKAAPRVPDAAPAPSAPSAPLVPSAPPAPSAPLVPSAPLAPSAPPAAPPTVSAEELLRIVRLLPDVVFRCERRADGQIVWTFNEGGLAEEFHLTTKDVHGKTLHEMFPPPVADFVAQHFERAFRGEPAEFVNELAGRSFRHFPQAVRDPSGKVVALVGFISDVTALKRAEEDLRRANQELEAFAYTVSHDLRTPLSVIAALVEVLRAQGDRLDARGQDALQRIGGAAERMGVFIGDVLAYSGAARQPLRRAAVDVGRLAQAVQADLRLRFPGHPVRFEVEPGLVAEADPTLLRVVLENLLSNAWKFTRGCPAPRVRLARAADGAWRVEDNGTGFDPKDAPLLFEAFRRLPGAARVEGTGVGLATVKKAVERHGGRVWAEGRPGAGAAFCFTLGPDAGVQAPVARPAPV